MREGKLRKMNEYLVEEKSMSFCSDGTLVYIAIGKAPAHHFVKNVESNPVRPSKEGT